MGIILTTSLFVLSGYQKKRTDDEIKDLAKELGMVEVEHQEDPLEQVLEEMIPTKLPTPIEPTGQPTVTPTPEPTPKPTVKPTQEPTKAPKPTEIPEGEEEIDIMIKGGMTSDSVSNLLYKAGLVDSAKKFNNYIIRVGKSKVIRVGKFTIQKGASFDEIIQIITE